MRRVAAAAAGVRFVAPTSEGRRRKVVPPADSKRASAVSRLGWTSGCLVSRIRIRIGFVTSCRGAWRTWGPGRLVGMVERRAPEKAPADFLAIAAAIPDATFVVVGDGPLRAPLAAAAGPNVRFLGFREDMPGVYASLDVLVQPSLREGMPMTILEAMASGLPVVATRVGAAGDVIDNGGTGMLVPARDVAAMTAAVRSLLRDDHGIGAAARQEVARNYTVDVMAGRYADAYRSVLGRTF